MKHSINQRRRLLIALGAGTLITTLATELTGGIAAYAQGSAPPARIGIISPATAAAYAIRLAAINQGMRENGLIEGKHYVVDLVSAEGHYDRFPRSSRNCCSVIRRCLWQAPLRLCARRNWRPARCRS